ARTALVRHGAELMRRLGTRGPAVPGMPRRRPAPGVFPRAPDRRRHPYRPGVLRPAQESRAENGVIALSTHGHREIHPSGATHGGPGARAERFPMARRIGVGTAPGGPGLNAVDHRRPALAFLSQKHGQFTYFSLQLRERDWSKKDVLDFG